jgi:hypothetical protein
MSVWYCIPSKRPIEEVRPLLAKWKERGYWLALHCDTDWEALEKGCDLAFSAPIYPGYAPAVNEMAAELMRFGGDSAQWFVTGGDDVEPDPYLSAEEIAQQCEDHFLGTFGVMQPTGDPWRDLQGRIIERIAGSPWMGREFCERVNGGRGPLWPAYKHCFVDEELQCVSQKLGVFWQRPDLTQLHQHWARKGGSMPDFLKEANSKEHWDKYKALFEARKAGGFPGHEPL